MRNLKSMRFPLSLVAALAAFVLPASPTARAAAEPGQVSLYVGRLLEQSHYTRRPLDDTMSSRLLQTYIETLDYNRIFFTQEDIEKLRAKYDTELDDYLLLGNPKAAQEIYAIYRKRVGERVALVNELIKQDHDFKSNRTIELSRQKSAWPRNEKEARDLWATRVEGELLQAKLNEHSQGTPAEVVARRYRQVLRTVTDKSEDQAVSIFLSSLAQVYDPHSEYLDRKALENFEINMKLSLVGIGAVLRSEDGYAKIIDLVAGGPADLEGRLKVNDRIAAVAQGNRPFDDVLDMPLDEVVELIRGKKGTQVRLMVLPAKATDPSMKSVIEITRDEVKLKDAEAKAEVIERTGTDGKPERLGWITLPSFYADMDHPRGGESKSTTRDMTRLLERLKKEQVTGIVLDLRRNGGGSLEEAVNLTGLFVGAGPIVQVKSTDGEIKVSRASQPALYDGPLVVLTSRLSASASEIFAAAMQDYGRAVLVGDTSTFGKGTVQTMLEIGRFMSPFGIGASDAGALKLTVQQFYRVNGGSTQLRGVLSDIVLPTLTDDPQIGEGSLKVPLPYDEVPPAPVKKFTDQASLSIDLLRERSQARVKSSPEFASLQEDIARRRTLIEKNTISLNEAGRRAEIAEDKARVEARKARRLATKDPQEMVYSLTLDNVDLPQLTKASNEKKPAADADDDLDDDKDDFDAGREEALNVLSDYVDTLAAPKTAQVK